ncbi:acyltransferase family protein [Chromobacterium subtsugae]|uniref:acyltransferase family protein n=1 Tax=Chromobacterium subtsugae TaxID=251747 RepID=UPI001364C1FB|nr:acyltransferase [Chromobacterium subtsugae]
MQAPAFRITGLDALRCISALIVMLFHCGFWAWAAPEMHPGYGGTNVSYEWLAPYTWHGWLGVESFFVISGFVITYSTQGSNVRDFLHKRFLRIFPALWICTSISFIAVAWANPEHLSITDLSLRLLNSALLAPYGPWIDGSVWTLSMEIFFYLIMSVAIGAGKIRHAAIITYIMALPSVFFWMLHLAAEFNSDAHTIFNTLLSVRYETNRLYEIFLIKHGCFFALGVLLYQIRTQKPTCSRMIIAILLFSVTCIEVFYQALSITQASRSHFPPWEACALWLFIAFLICWAIWQGQGKWPKLPLPEQGMKKAGAITYPLYLLNQTIGYIFLDFSKNYLPDTAALILCILAITALSVFVSFFIEPTARSITKTTLKNINQTWKLIISSS